MKNIYILLALCLVSCGGRNESIDINRKIHGDIINKEIGSTNGLTLLTTKDRNYTEYTFLTILDSSCNTCFQIMNDWEKFVFPDQLKKVKKQFIVQGQLTDVFKRFLSERKSGDIEIFLDTSQSFLVKNRLTSYYQKTLLLDSSRKVIYVGTPLDEGLVEADLKELVND